MKSVLVIGYGNELRGDDALGPRVANDIAGKFSECTSLAVAQLTPDLSAVLAKFRTVIFVDALDDAQVEDVLVKPIEMHPGGAVTTHASNPMTLLALAELLFGRKPAAWHVLVPGDNFAIGTELSVRAERMFRIAIDKVAALIQCESRSGCTNYRSP